MSKKTSEQSASDRLEAAMLAAIEEIEGQIAIVSSRRDQLSEGGFDKDLANTAASLARALASLNAEHRAGLKAREFTAKNISPEIVMEHLRLITADQRAHYIREMKALEDTTSVLG